MPQTASVSSSKPRRATVNAGAVTVSPRPAAPRNTSLWLALLLAIGMVGIAIIFQVRPHRPQQTASPVTKVRTAKIVSGPLVSTLRLSGITAAANSVYLSVPQALTRGGDSMLVLRSSAKAGNPVLKGDIVAEFDRRSSVKPLEQYRAAVAAAEAELNFERAKVQTTQRATQLQIDSAKEAWDKARLELRKVPVVSKLEAERINLDISQAEAQYRHYLERRELEQLSHDTAIRASEIALAQAKLELEEAERSARAMVVVAPINGIPIMRPPPHVEENGKAQEGGFWPGQMFMQIADPGSIFVKAPVNQVDLQWLRLGQRAMVHFDDVQSLPLPAHIVSVEGGSIPGAPVSGHADKMYVKLALDKNDGRVVPERRVTVEITSARAPQSASIVPLSALFERGGRTFVYIRGISGWESRSVQPTSSNNRFAAILKGLKPGDVVALDEPVPNSIAAK